MTSLVVPKADPAGAHGLAKSAHSGKDAGPHPAGVATDGAGNGFESLLEEAASKQETASHAPASHVPKGVATVDAGTEVKKPKHTSTSATGKARTRHANPAHPVLSAARTVAVGDAQVPTPSAAGIAVAAGAVLPLQGTSAGRSGAAATEAAAHSANAIARRATGATEPVVASPGVAQGPGEVFGGKLRAGQFDELAPSATRSVGGRSMAAAADGRPTSRAETTAETKQSVAASGPSGTSARAEPAKSATVRSGATTPHPPEPGPNRVGSQPLVQAQGQGQATVQPGGGVQEPVPSPVSSEGTGPLPGVAGQLLHVISAPRPVGVGSYTVTVDLHPPSLGSVRATVVAGPNHVAVQLTPATVEGANALRLAVPELQQSLSQNGQQSQVTIHDNPAASSGSPFSFSSGQGGGGQSPAMGQHTQPSSASTSRSASPESVAATERATAGPSTDHLVDIRV